MGNKALDEMNDFEMLQYFQRKTVQLIEDLCKTQADCGDDTEICENCRKPIRNCQCDKIADEDGIPF